MANLRTRRPRLDPDSFIAAAEAPQPANGPNHASQRPRQAESRGRAGGRLPWEQPGVRADVTKPFNLRLPEPLKLKLDYIRERTRDQRPRVRHERAWSQPWRPSSSACGARIGKRA